MVKTGSLAFNLLISLALGLVSTSDIAADSQNLKAEPMTAFKTWRDLKITEPLTADGAVNYYAFPLKNGSHAHLCVLDLKSKAYCVRPAVNSSTCPTSTTSDQNKAVAAVNGGFFNLSNGESTSYVTLEGKLVCDPTVNKDLVNNPKLAPFLETIFNRSELRILSGGKGDELAIAAHKDLVPKNRKLQFVIGGGPQLLPRLTSKDEAFIRTGSDGKPVDSIGCNRTAARTAIGITSDDHFLILCVAGKGQDEFSSGITLTELASLLQSLGCKQALNFDGGTSTTMVISPANSTKSKDSGVSKDSGISQSKMVCGRAPETRVKSVLMIAPR